LLSAFCVCVCMSLYVCVCVGTYGWETLREYAGAIATCLYMASLGNLAGDVAILAEHG